MKRKYFRRSKNVIVECINADVCGTWGVLTIAWWLVTWTWLGKPRSGVKLAAQWVTSIFIYINIKYWKLLRSLNKWYNILKCFFLKLNVAVIRFENLDRMMTIVIHRPIDIKKLCFFFCIYVYYYRLDYKTFNAWRFSGKG